MENSFNFDFDIAGNIGVLLRDRAAGARHAGNGVKCPGARGLAPRPALRGPTLHAPVHLYRFPLGGLWNERDVRFRPFAM